MPTWKTVCDLGTKLPEVETSTSYGTPALKVRGKLLVRLKEDGQSIVVRVEDLDTKESLLSLDPEVFFTTPHYDGHASVLVRLSRAKRAVLADLLRNAYRAYAPKKLAAVLTKD